MIMKDSEAVGNRPSLRLFPSWQRQQHRNLSPVFFIGFAVNTAKIALFHLNRDKNVGSRSNREDQMADSHFWCSPKRDNETYHNWMADKAVKPRGPKTEILVLLVKKDLPQAKQIEVINQKGADENDGPAGKGHDPQDQKTRRAFNVPDNSEQGLPLP